MAGRWRAGGVRVVCGGWCAGGVGGVVDIQTGLTYCQPCCTQERIEIGSTFQDTHSFIYD